MGRHSDEDEDRGDPVAMRDGSDEDEANEDLSLKILEKALSRRELDETDLCGSGLVSTVMVTERDSKSHKKKKKKKKRTNLEDNHEIQPIVFKDQDEEKTVEDGLKRKHDEVEKSAEPKPSNMVLKKLLRGARYFDPPDTGWETCYSCGEQGHVTINCPTPTKRKKPCFICGSLEHGAKQCSKGHDCYICKKGDHRAKDCPDKYKSGSKTAVCLRCGEFGHDMIFCKYEYSQDDLKEIQCYVCKNFGHLCCVEPGNLPAWAMSCYRCGQLGHIGLACGRYYEESTEKDSASSCFRCGEEGHFSRECPNSSSISSSHGRDSPSLCYRCNGAGHFARECPNSSQVAKRNRETSTPRKSHKKIKETPEYTSTPHESCGKKKTKKSKDNSEHDSTPHESNGKMKKKKSKENSEYDSTHESNGKMNNKKKTQQPHSTPQKSKQRGGCTEDPEEESFQRGKMSRPRSPVTPSGHNHHRLPTTYMGRHKQRSPTFHSGGNFPGSRLTTPHGRHHRNSSFESSGHVPSHPPARWQPYYPPRRHQHNHNQRYAPAPSRYGSAHHYDEFQGDYDRW